MGWGRELIVGGTHVHSFFSTTSPGLNLEKLFIISDVMLSNVAIWLARLCAGQMVGSNSQGGIKGHRCPTVSRNASPLLCYTMRHF